MVVESQCKVGAVLIGILTTIHVLAATSPTW